MTYFVYLKDCFLFLLCSLLSSKNSFNFLGGEGGPERRGVIDFRWNPTGGRGSRKHNFEEDF